jgi:hypothetical protein
MRAGRSAHYAGGGGGWGLFQQHGTEQRAACRVMLQCVQLVRDETCRCLKAAEPAVALVSVYSVYWAVDPCCDALVSSLAACKLPLGGGMFVGISGYDLAVAGRNLQLPHPPTSGIGVGGPAAALSGCVLLLK